MATPSGLMFFLPGIEELHALRDSLGVIVSANFRSGLTVATDRALFPFCTATGRNAHAKSLFNSHAGMRSSWSFSPDTIGSLSRLAHTGSRHRRRAYG